jgi:hypothetical protein
MYQTPLISRGAMIHKHRKLRGPSDISAQSSPAFYLSAITPLLSAAAAVLHDEHEHPLLVNSNQSLTNNDQNALNVAVDDDDKINV